MNPLEIPDDVLDLELKKELARRCFWDFEQLMYPELYTDSRPLLKEVADTIQDFYENSLKHYLILSLPPGHYKSFTGKNFVLWVEGKDPTTRVISASNSHDLAEQFSSQIRDTILGVNFGRGGCPYPSIFPNTKVKSGYATKSKWELEGSLEPSYRATSPTSSLTGSRATLFLIDDIIKNHAESLNAQALQNHFNWFKNTLFSRADGDNYKFIFIMQRWAKADLAGEVMELHGDDVVHIEYPVEKNGVMLEPSIMSKTKLEEARKTLSPEVFKANYYQTPVDIEGRLYKGFQEWDILPESVRRFNNTDVADQGKDYLCSINWFEFENKAYITDIYYSNAKAEITEPEVAKIINADQIHQAEFESNNGGKGYARNIKRELELLGNKMTVVEWIPQNSNKEARILASSAWVSKNVLMPPNWTSKFAEFASEVLGYVAGGKNVHDDGVDVLATIYERVANTQQLEYGGVR